MKKISIIGTVGIPAKYGGFETLTEYLTRNLHGNTVSIKAIICGKNTKKAFCK